MSVGETGVGEMGIGETGQIIGETGVGETGVGEKGVTHNAPPYTPLLYCKIGVYRGLHYFCSKT